MVFIEIPERKVLFHTRFSVNYLQKVTLRKSRQTSLSTAVSSPPTPRKEHRQSMGSVRQSQQLCQGSPGWGGYCTQRWSAARHGVCKETGARNGEGTHHMCDNLLLASQEWNQPFNSQSAFLLLCPAAGSTWGTTCYVSQRCWHLGTQRFDPKEWC